MYCHWVSITKNMGFIILHYNIILLVMMYLFALGYTQDFIWSRATYYGSPNCPGNPNGACGYGELGSTLNNGYVAGVHRPYKNGTGCGGCYQVRCKGGCCTDEGVVVVATDFGVGDWVDFLFPAQVYAKLARPGFEAELLSYGVVDIEFRRVPCTYGGSPSSLVFKIHDSSKFPHYLAFIILHAPGLYDVVGVQVWQEDCKEWRPMRKPYGAVWDMENPPSGPLNLRFQLSASIDDAKWVELPNIIAAYWQSGDTYSTTI